MNRKNESFTADREIITRRVLNAPRELVYRIWTDPQHVAQWWGPAGFRNTFSEFSMKPGGGWRFVMHGPDGTDYLNQITFIEVVPSERLVYTHGTGESNDPRQFHVEISFTALGDKTEVTLRSIFQSKEARDFVVREHGAIEGARQTLARLAGHLHAVGLENSGAPIKLSVTRRFKASAERVFDAWTNAEHVRKWLFATPGGEMLRVEVDARAGGRFVVVEKRGDMEAYHAGEYFEIDRPRRLVFSFGIDEALTDAGLVQVEIKALDNGCELTLTQTMHPKFAEYAERTQQGWTTLLRKLDQLLS